jgi:hypothetical protein
MKELIASWVFLLGLLFIATPHFTSAQNANSPNIDTLSQTDSHFENDQDQGHIPDAALEPLHEEEHGHAPGWLVIPFIVLLLMIATGPLFYEHFWHHNYPKIAVGLALIVVLYYLFVLNNVHNPVHALAEYIQFISLLASFSLPPGGFSLMWIKNPPHGQRNPFTGWCIDIESDRNHRCFYVTDPPIYQIKQKQYSTLSHHFLYFHGQQHRRFAYSHRGPAPFSGISERCPLLLDPGTQLASLDIGPFHPVHNVLLCG